MSQYVTRFLDSFELWMVIAILALVASLLYRFPSRLRTVSWIGIVIIVGYGILAA